VIGSTDFFRTGDTSEKLYTEVISATVPLVSVRGVSGPMEIIASEGVRWRSVGNRLNTQCVPTEVTGFRFEYDDSAGAGQAIWDQTAPSNDACGLRLNRNRWDMTSDGWALRAVVGDYFAFTYNTVRGNELTRQAVDVRSNGTCTDVGVVVSHNIISDVSGSGIYAPALNCFKLNHNDLDNVGGYDGFSFIPYSLRTGVCDATSYPPSVACTEIRGNRVRTTQVVSALVGLMATCWFEPVPSEDKQIRIENNDCRGLSIGIRFDQIPDNSPSSDPKQMLRYRSLNEGNVQSKGLNLVPIGGRYDLVRGPPADDFSLITDPNSPANEGRWCTDGCPEFSDWIIWGPLIFLGIVALTLAACFLITGCCTLSKYTMPLVRIITLSRPPIVQGIPSTALPNDPYMASMPTQLQTQSVRQRRPQRAAAPGGEEEPLLGPRPTVNDFAL